MPGVNLNLSLPLLSDNLATSVSKTATALLAIQNDLTPKVTAGALNINASLPFNGNAATGLGSVQLASGNTPTAAGSVYYLNGEFYLIDSTGTIQLTVNGAINAAGIGGIVGDYGGVNPAKVTYVAASSQYQFTTSPGVWAILVADSILLEGSAGTVQMGVNSALTGTKTANWKSLPSSGVSPLVYNAATGTIEDGGATTITNPILSTSTIGAASYKFSSGVTVVLPAVAGVKGNGSTAAPAYGGTYGTLNHWNFGSDANPILFSVPIPNGAQITSYGARISKTSGTTEHVRVILTKAALGGAEANADTANAGGIDYNVNNPGAVTIVTMYQPTVAPVDGATQYQIAVYVTGSLSDVSLYWVFFTYVMP